MNVTAMEVEEELRRLLSRVDDPSQRKKTLELWQEIKGKLSDKQRLAILQAWNTYLVDADMSLFDHTIQNVIDDLDRRRETNRVQTAQD